MSPTSTSQSFGTTLKEMRDLRGKTQADVAAVVGVSRATIAQWEAGRHLPSPERSVALDDYLEAQGTLRRTGREAGSSRGPRALGERESGRNLLTVFRRVEAALEHYLERDGDGRPLGWCHNLQDRDPPTPMATAYGIKAALLIEEASKADLGALGKRLTDLAMPDGGWGTGAQLSSRPEAIAVVVDALVRVDPTTDLTRPMELLEEKFDEISAKRPFIMATVLETVLDLRPDSSFAADLIRKLLESRRAHGETETVRMLWCQKADDRLADPEPSVVHTARAVCVLARAKSTTAVPEPLVGEVDDALGAAVEWLLLLEKPNLENTSEWIDRAADDRRERLSVRHFTPSWVVRALLLAGERPSHPTVTLALKQMRSHYNEERSLWRWSTGDLPIWMTFDAIAALRLAALASYLPY